MKRLPEAASLSITNVPLEHPKELAHGDYATSIAMGYTTELKKSPREIAELLKEELLKDESLNEVVSAIEIAGPGFINFTLKPGFLLEQVSEILRLKDQYGAQDFAQGRKALIEYSQMNVAKPMHVGHLRTMILGDSLKRLYRFVGYEVLSDTHYGDWGTQFGMVLYAFKHWGDEEQVKKDPVGELVRLYIEMSAKVEDDKDLYETAKAEFKKLEDGDKENLRLWKWFVDASVQVFDEVYKLMGILPFEHHLGESFYEDKMKAEIKRVKKAEIATNEDELLYVDLEKENLGRCILVKSDGASTYHLRDLAAYTYRFDELKVDKNLYVVDSRQAHHFRQLFKVAELLGLPGITASEHVSYGFVTLPDGSLSTRKGRIVQAKEVIEQGIERAKKVVEEKNPELPDKDNVTLEVTRAAIKFLNLSANRNTDIVFDWEQILRFDGDTGPYLQYTYARIQSILRKARMSGVVSGADLTEAETDLLRVVYRFPEEVAKAYHHNDPHFIAQFLLSLSHEFNSFYANTPVLQAEEAVRLQRLALCAAVAQVIKNGLELLGINVLEEM